MNKYLIILCSLACFTSVFGQEEETKAISSEKIKQHLYTLANDSMEGRETGMKGQKMAAAYIEKEFKSYGIPPSVNGTYIQSFPLKVESSDGATIVLKEDTLEFIEDFYFFPGFESTVVDGKEMVFAGYGIEDKNYNDYANIDVKDKVVMVISGEPFDKKGNSLITENSEVSVWSTDGRKKSELAKEKGAIAVLIVDMNYQNYISRVKYYLQSPMMRLDYGEKRGEELMPTAFITPSKADQLFSSKKYKSIEDVKKRIYKKGKPYTQKIEANFKLNLVRTESNYSAENVLGFIEGTDEKLKDEIVVITAHYDHIGIVNGEINNGADDDGSGTSSALAIAEQLANDKKMGFGTKRSVLVMTVSGEEKGLLGSEWYTEFPLYALENTVCNLNIDMIGRVDEKHEKDENYVYIIGSDRLSSELHQISEDTNQKYTALTLDYTYNDENDPNRFYYRSDHYNFAKNNIPVIFYFSGVHEDYHKPGDDAEKIMFDKTAKIATLVYRTAVEVANRNDRLKVDVKN